MRAWRPFVLLFRMQFASIRWFWRSMLVTSIVIPLFTMTVCKFLLLNGGATRADALYFVAGNIVVGLLFGNMGRVASRFSFLRDSGALDYYATLVARKTWL